MDNTLSDTPALTPLTWCPTMAGPNNSLLAPITLSLNKEVREAKFEHLPIKSLLCQHTIQANVYCHVHLLCWTKVSNALSSQKQPNTFGAIFQPKAYIFRKIYEEEMFIRTLPATLLQIFSKSTLIFKVIVESI